MTLRSDGQLHSSEVLRIFELRNVETLVFPSSIKNQKSSFLNRFSAENRGLRHSANSDYDAVSIKCRELPLPRSCRVLPSRRRQDGSQHRRGTSL